MALPGGQSNGCDQWQAASLTSRHLLQNKALHKRLASALIWTTLIPS
ncbi:hypothetical protein ACU4GI_32325 [Cupriavidus basilensis]|nr:hypothetical protein [Cupriavidus basilensis]MDF3886309.1 hypothetical protein [Cupriavidus basilensis]